MRLSQRKAGILLNYMSEAIKILTALLYTPIMLRLLGQSEYGLYQLVNSTVSYLSLLSLGFGSAYVRYYSLYRVKEDNAGIARLNGMFISIFCVMTVVCLICGGVMVANMETVFGSGLTERELAKAKILFLILIGNMALTFPNSVFNCYVTANEQFVFQKLLMLAQSILNPFLTLPLLLLGYGSVAMVIITTLLTVISFVVNIYFCLSRLNMRFSFKKMEFSLMKEMSAFTFFIFLNQIIDQANWSVDKFLLGRMCGTTAVAIYGIGGQLNSMYIQMSASISTVFTPKINLAVAKSNDNSILSKLMIKVGRIQFLVIALVLTGFIIFGRAFIQLWVGEGYDDAYVVAILLMVPMLVPLIQNIGLVIQQAKNKHRARSIVYGCLALTNVIITVFLIPRWGVIGAAIGTAITQFFGVVLFMNWYYHARLGLDIVSFWKKICRMLPAVLLSLAVGGVYAAAVDIASWEMLIISIVIYVMLYCFFMWTIGFNRDDKIEVRNLISSLGKKQ